MEKATKLVPQDPDGTETIHPGLIISAEQITEILEQTMAKSHTWLLAEKQNHALKTVSEGKELQDKSVEELDENLRKQWPRKGRLEVEVYQERKAQISAHNNKYERHVRIQLEKYNMLEDQWVILLDTVEQEFKAYQEKNSKLKAQLPTSKNLAMLQGMSRREKDSYQIFEEKCNDFKD